VRGRELRDLSILITIELGNQSDIKIYAYTVLSLVILSNDVLWLPRKDLQILALLPIVAALQVQIPHASFVFSLLPAEPKAALALEK
jgi:hypothetical protein